MRLVTVQQMREIDEAVIQSHGVPGVVLMDRAGYGVAQMVRQLAEFAPFAPSILVFAGRGNNGGDALAAARYLHQWGLKTDVWLVAETSRIRGDALEHLQRLKAAGVEPQELARPEEWERVLSDPRPTGAILVDGILGTGSSGPPRGLAAMAIKAINWLAENNLVVSIDIPSGLNSDTGEAQGKAVHADLTATIALPKTGMIQPRAIEYVGSLDVIDIGFPSSFYSVQEGEDQLITSRDIRPLFRKRPRASHKGNFGHALLIGGTPGYAGAVGLAARAAQRSGCGLVTALVPESIAAAVAGMSMESMIHAGKQTSSGSLAATALASWRKSLNDFDAILIGPGMTPTSDTLQLLTTVLKESKVPVVVDADALNACRDHPEWLGEAQCPVLITPHPGELARLLGCSPAEIQADRFAAARRIAEATHAVVVLKGAGTIVTRRGETLHLNLTGNPGLATGGTGDALGGLLAGFLAQGRETFDAARAAVWIHGRAGDFAAWKSSYCALQAGDLIDEIPFALRMLNGW
ncbi:MAG: NAD(P)H-hydrate dehydratase [Kiritimatiellia bacterium]